jgi:ubiquinone/menaquinone biosynthesis C-methylase UbiE
MTSKETNAYYDSHWKDFSDLDYPSAKIEKARDFFHPVLEKVKGTKTVLDVGCGDGVLWNYLKRIEKISGNYFGVDISFQAVNFLNKVSDKKEETFFVMDASNLDFPDNHFDVVFAYGVVGYMDDPKGALQEIYRVCKPGGLIGIFSPDIKGFSKTILFTVRSFAKILGNRGKRILANFLVPFFGLAPSETQISLKNAGWRQVCEVILTDIAPPKLEVIEYQKMITWFDKLNIKIIFDSAKNKTILWGNKSS